MGKSTRCSPLRSAQLTPTAPGHFTTTNQAVVDAGKGMPREKAHSFKPDLFPSLNSTFNGSSTYVSDFNRSPPRSPTRAPRPRDHFGPGPAVPGAFETTNMAVNNVILSAHQNHAVVRPSPVVKSDHGPLNAPTTGLDTNRSTYRSEFYTKPMTRGLSPNRRFVHSPVTQTPENRDFVTSNGLSYRWQ